MALEFGPRPAPSGAHKRRPYRGVALLAGFSVRVLTVAAFIAAGVQGIGDAGGRRAMRGGGRGSAARGGCRTGPPGSENIDRSQSPTSRTMRMGRYDAGVADTGHPRWRPAWWTVLRSPGHSNGPRLKMPASMGTRPIGWASVAVRTRPQCHLDGESPKRRAAYGIRSA